MKKLLMVVMVVLLLGACAGPSEPDIELSDAWSRQSPKMANASAAFLVITNSGGAADALLGASTDVCDTVELHESIMEDDVMKMRPVEGGRIEIPGNEVVELKPGGLHVMLIGPKHDLRPGDLYILRLEFEKSGIRTVQVKVQEAGTMEYEG